MTVNCRSDPYDRYSSEYDRDPYYRSRDPYDSRGGFPDRSADITTI